MLFTLVVLLVVVAYAYKKLVVDRAKLFVQAAHYLMVKESGISVRRANAAVQRVWIAEKLNESPGRSDIEAAKRYADQYFASRPKLLIDEARRCGFRG